MTFFAFSLNILYLITRSLFNIWYSIGNFSVPYIGKKIILLTLQRGAGTQVTCSFNIYIKFFFFSSKKVPVRRTGAYRHKKTLMLYMYKGWFEYWFCSNNCHEDLFLSMLDQRQRHTNNYIYLISLRSENPVSCCM